ncbi:hypothetical protein CLM83_08715, partial [Streptomyces albidoflavus]
MAGRVSGCGPCTCSRRSGRRLRGGFTRDGDGGLHNASPLSSSPSLAPLSWVLQMLGIFFLVGGY